MFDFLLHFIYRAMTTSMMTPISQRSTHNGKPHLLVAAEVVVEEEEEVGGVVEAETTLLPSGQPPLSLVKYKNTSRARP